MADTDIRLSTIGQIAIPVKDVGRAVAFYRDALGMKFLFQAPPGLAFFDAGGVRLMLDLPEDKEFQHLSSPLYFRVEDIQTAFLTLKKRGVSFRGEPHVIARMPPITLWMAFFWDSEGNTHALMAEVKDG